MLVVGCGRSTPDAPTTAPVAAPAPTAQTAGPRCFRRALNKDTVTVQLTFAGDRISGSMVRAPFEKDRATGSLAGSRAANGELELEYAYTIEGSAQTEPATMRLEDKQLLLKRAPLEDPGNDGHLRYATGMQAVYWETLEEVPCR